MEGQLQGLIDALDDDPNRNVSRIDMFLLGMLTQIEQLHTQRKLSGPLQRFLDLQDDFRWNLAGHLLEVYRRQEWLDTAVLVANQVLQGLVLLHPPLRELFHRKLNMYALVRLLDDMLADVVLSTITTLIHILLKDLDNFRLFEAAGGCLHLIRRLDLSDADQRGLNYKIIEFLLVYFVDERGAPHSKTIEEKSMFFREEFPGIDGLLESLNQLKEETVA